MKKRVPVDPDRSGVREVWAYYRQVRSLLRASDSIFRLRAEILGEASGAALREMVRELEREVTLTLVTCFEACLQVDYLDRIGRRSRDEVSRAFREKYGRGEGRRARLVDLLDIWRDEGCVRNRLIDDFKKLLQFRNWLAHGRYFILKSKAYDPEEALRVAEALFEELEERHGFTEYRRSISD